jgi:hypothetical protein
MSATPNSLTDLENVKNFYGMTGSKQLDDDLLEDLIDRISEAIYSYCNVTSFKEKTYTEYQDGAGSKYLFVNNTPIISVTSINDDEDWEWGLDTVIDSSQYRIVDKRYIVWKDDYFTNADQNIKIIYKAGYSTVPGDLEQVCIEEVLRRYKHRRDIDVQSKTLDDGTVQYTSKNFMQSSLTVLNKYRNDWVY